MVRQWLRCEPQAYSRYHVQLVLEVPTASREASRYIDTFRCLAKVSRVYAVCLNFSDTDDIDEARDYLGTAPLIMERCKCTKHGTLESTDTSDALVARDVIW